MYDLNSLPNDDIAEDWEEGEDGWKGRGSIDNQEWNMIDLEAIRKVPDACPSIICVSYNNNLMSSVDEFRGELVNVALDSTRLGKEEVADHSNVVRHDDGLDTPRC